MSGCIKYLLVVVGSILWIASVIVLLIGSLSGRHRVALISLSGSSCDVEVQAWREPVVTFALWRSHPNAATAAVWSRRAFGVGVTQAGTDYGKIKNTVYLPLYFPMGTGALLILASFVSNSHKVADPGRCKSCGYDLRASRERCPECGTHFEPPKDGAGTDGKF